MCFAKRAKCTSLEESQNSKINKLVLYQVLIDAQRQVFFKSQSFFCPQVTREPEPNSCESLKKCKSYHPEPNEYVPGPAGKSAPVPAPANIKLALDPVQSDFLAMNIKNSETAGRPYNIHELPSVDGTSAFLHQTSEDYQSKHPIASRSHPQLFLVFPNFTSDIPSFP